MTDSFHAEELLIATLMVNADAMADIDGIIDHNDFYATHTRLIFEAITTVAEHVAMPTAPIVAEELTRTGNLQTVGGVDQLLRISELWSPRSNLVALAETIVDHAVLRAIKRVAQQVDELAGMTGNSDEAVNQATKLVDGLTAKASRSNVRTIGDVIGDYRKHMDQPFQAVPTGFAALDALTGGWTPGDLNIIGAPSGHGKSSVANVSVIASCKAGRPTVLQTLELSETEASNRLVAVLAQVDLAKLTRKSLTKPERAARDTALDIIESWPLVIDVDSDPTIGAMRAKARFVRREYGSAGLWVFDHIQHSKALAPGAQSKREQVDEVSAELKNFAKREDVPMVATVQLNNASANRSDKRPQQYDIRESAAPFHYASVALFAFRPAKVGMFVDDENEAELIVRKQRNGPEGVVPVDWVGPYATYVGRGHTSTSSPPPSGRTAAEWLEHATVGSSNSNGHYNGPYQDF